jgi:hypothetical protein
MNSDPNRDTVFSILWIFDNKLRTGLFFAVIEWPKTTDDFNITFRGIG